MNLCSFGSFYTKSAALNQSKNNADYFKTVAHKN